MTKGQLRKSLLLHLVIVFLISAFISLSAVYFILHRTAEDRDTLVTYCSLVLYILAYFSISSLTSCFALKETIRTNAFKTLVSFFLLPLVAFAGLVMFLFSHSFGYNGFLILVIYTLPTLLFFMMYITLFFRFRELTNN
ncbi:MAG: hypothetical protein M3R17_06805 [Bacteroidota bacterium]|nr:hypothetical protein [Bacteroidota bacterium]